MDRSREYATWVEVDLDAIEGNLRALSAQTNAGLMAVVKADGYGHGAIEVAHAAARAGAEWFGVARAEEALRLREAGIIHPILVLAPVPSEALATLAAQGISITVFDEDHLASAVRAAQGSGTRARVHLKVDTGMSRLGAMPEEAASLAQVLAEGEALEFEGVFTHFASADEPESATSLHQLSRFEEVLSQLDADGMRPPIVHAGNSAATLQLPQSHYDLVRVGIAMYGLQPSREWALPEEFRPALQWKSALSRVRELPAGTGVSYGHDYVTQRDERIGTFPVGYADGLRRVDGNRALVGGRDVPVVGRVCMDLTMVQLDSVTDAAAGDELVLIGRQGEAEISAEQVAERWGTINYEVTCAIGGRVPRLITVPPVVP